IKIANDLPKESSPQPNMCSMSSRWPVEDTGKNSVKPSTIPRTAALIRSTFAAAGPSMAAMVASNCMNDSGEFPRTCSGDYVGQRFWRKGAGQATKKDEICYGLHHRIGFL